jgi:hypothetical protein
VAARRDVLVPSLVADRLVTADEGREAVSAAERHLVETRAALATSGPSGNGGAAPVGLEPAASGNGAGSNGPSVACPVCGAVLGVFEAADHEHLRVAPVAQSEPL